MAANLQSNANQPSAGPSRLREVADSLRRRVGSELSFKLIRTRVFLRTGIDLSTIPEERDFDAESVLRVVRALEECGHRLDWSEGKP